ncbi:SCL-interrupting locus protein [Pseudophryne corroboree]|uniref:SCL-interrupting locus protein n=1 Tax=Pseudophryne corroboree TaxID=495146 RepID=UPI0030818A66
MSMKSLQYHKEGQPAASENQINMRNMANRMLPINFPPTRTVLWDSTPVGDAIGLHFSYYRNPRVLLSEKALRLSYRHAKNERRLFSCFLLGSFSVDDDEEGITLTIDRFDPGRDKSGSVGKVPSTPLPGDFAIPCSISYKETGGTIVLHTPEDFTSSFMGLQSHLHSKEALDLCKLLTMRAHITYSENMDNLHFDLRWAAVTVANTFESTPIKPVPIIPTALARNLSSHHNIAQLQGTHKCGYLTMDQTRKLLLVLESDPKAYTLPLVGIWMSGITHIHSPQVWASCLRYMFSSSVKERVLSEGGSFLIVLYSLTHKEPEFYECVPCIGHDPLGFQLMTCEDGLHLFKNVESTKQSYLQYELNTPSQDSEASLFNEVSKTTLLKQNVSPSKLSVSDHDSGVEDEDFSPRPSPRPHPSFQQVTKIHPSVPELSLVFGSAMEPKHGAQNPEDSSKKVQPCSSTTKVINQFMNATHQNNNLHGKTTSLKSLGVPVKNSKSQAAKPSRGKYCTGDKLPTHGNARSSTSSTSSSSLSTPQTGTSPDTSVHQVRGSPGQQLNCSVNGSCPEQSTMTPTAYPRQSSLLQSPNHNVTFPHQTRQIAESPNYSPCHKPNICNCCHNIGPMQCHSSPWPAVSYINHCGMESPSEAPGNVIPPYQNMACSSACCTRRTSTGRVRSCSPPVDNVTSPGRRDSLPMNACSSHQCLHAASPAVPAPGGMLGLSTEAYQLLAEQDKQLKLLQAQIQRLLEAQTSQGDSKCTRSTQQCAESTTAAAETSEHTRKSSVSIAVSTGASLFWNSPCPEEEESLSKQDESELCNELSAAVNNEQDTSRTSIASSLKAVDIYSFAESSQLTDCGSLSPPVPLPVCNVQNKSHSRSQSDRRLSTNVSMEATSPEYPGNTNTADLGMSMPSLPPEKFYQDLLSQVNHLLKTSSSDNDESSEYGSRAGSGTCESNSEKSSEHLSCNTSQTEQGNVLKATLKQLKSFGVDMDTEPSASNQDRLDSGDNACVLACINPEAVIPRLNYMSFTNIGLSGLVPNGVDLSMEANAIALKYLSEAQLTQLSLNHANKNKPPDSSSFHHLFSGGTEKTMFGLSLISPSNMSFATKKYLKRYALIESNDSSDDEPEMPSGNGGTNSDQLDIHQSETPGPPDHTQNLRFASGPKPNLRISERECLESSHNQEGNKLRNITNEISGKVPSMQASEETPVCFLKDLNAKTKFTAGKAQFTGHPEKENGRNSPVFNARDSNSSGRKITGPAGSPGDILDVNRLRQLPKLF